MLPDFVSVNVHEPEAEAIVALMQARGIGVEAGLGRRRRPQRFVKLADAALQPAGAGRDDGARTRDRPRPRRRRSSASSRGPACACPVLLHGEGATVWPMVRMAADRGFATRVGFEDGREIPEGALAASNAALVAAAARILAG